jgi:hypothetical protein
MPMGVSVAAAQSWWEVQRSEVEDWCRERSGIPRILVLLWLGAILVYLWRDPPQRGLFDWPNLFSGINLGIHELGHVLLAPLGTFMGILGGSLVQCLAPLAGMVSLHRQSDYFGLAVCGGWLSTNLFGVATYMADAEAQQLPLVSPFSGHPLHDWHFLFTELGWLEASEGIGFATKLAALLVMVVSLGFGAWLVLKMMR